MADKVVIHRKAARDLIAVNEVVAITLDLVDCGIENETIIIATGISTPVHLLTDAISTILKAAPRRIFRETGCRHLYDTSKLKRLVNVPDFDESYPVTILNRYVPQIHSTCVTKDR